MSNTNPYHPPSIADAGGIEAFLDKPEQLAKHNGLGSKALKTRLRLHVPYTQISRDFGVKTTETVKNWVRQLDA